MGRRCLFGGRVFGFRDTSGRGTGEALVRSGPPDGDSRVGLPRAWVTSGLARRLRWAVAAFSAGSAFLGFRNIVGKAGRLALGRYGR